MSVVEELLGQCESKTLEFKRDLSSPKPLLKSLVAFANSAGGRLVIGISDDKKIVGVADPLDAEERLCNLIADAISPRLVPNIELVTAHNKTCMIVEVFLSNSRPHWINSEGAENGVYVRLGSTNRKADQALIAELKRPMEGLAFDEMPMPELSVHSLDIAAIQTAFAGKRVINEQTLINLKLLTSTQGRLAPTKGAILLFGKQRDKYFSDAWIQCGRFYGTEKLDLLDHIDITDPLPQAVEQVMFFLKKHAFKGADLSDLYRRDVWNIPLAMLREGIVNAVVHSDYSQRGAPIRVVFLDDRIEIESPGILLPGLTIEDIKQGTSRIRNHVIARIFRELGLIEQWGTGVSRIFQQARELKLPEPLLEERGMHVRLTIFVSQRQAASISIGAQSRAQSGAQSGAQSRAQSEAHADSILLLLVDGPLSAAELVRALGLSSKTGAFKREIKALMERGKIAYTIPDNPSSRSQKYRLVQQDEPFS